MAIILGQSHSGENRVKCCASTRKRMRREDHQSWGNHSISRQSNESNFPSRANIIEMRSNADSWTLFFILWKHLKAFWERYSYYHRLYWIDLVWPERSNSHRKVTFWEEHFRASSVAKTDIIFCRILSFKTRVLQHHTTPHLSSFWCCATKFSPFNQLSKSLQQQASGPNPNPAEPGPGLICRDHCADPDQIRWKRNFLNFLLLLQYGSRGRHLQAYGTAGLKGESYARLNFLNWSEGMQRWFGESPEASRPSNAILETKIPGSSYFHVKPFFFSF